MRKLSVWDMFKKKNLSNAISNENDITVLLDTWGLTSDKQV